MLYSTIKPMGVLTPRDQTRLYLSDVVDTRWLEAGAIRLLSTLDTDCVATLCGTFGPNVSEASDLYAIDIPGQETKLISKRQPVAITLDKRTAWFPYLLVALDARGGSSEGTVQVTGYFQQWQQSGPHEGQGRGAEVARGTLSKAYLATLQNISVGSVNLDRLPLSITLEGISELTDQVRESINALSEQLIELRRIRFAQSMTLAHMGIINNDLTELSIK